MKKFLRVGWLTMIAVIAFSLAAIGQETTGSVEVTVKDEAGAVVPNASVTIEGPSYKRTASANDSGYVKFVLVPPGAYTVTVAPVAGFAERRAPATVTLGTTVSVPIVMGTSLDAGTVLVTDDPGINITDDNGNTNLTSEMVQLIPKGVNFSTVLKYSPATRPEPRSGQFQIDGASGAENTFIVDGQEVTDIGSGFLNRNVNLPLSFLQETQVKNTGFEAEFGGALGGVINMVTKSGTNLFHGEAGFNMRTWRIEPTPYMVLFGRTISQSLNSPIPTYYPSRKSPDTEINPIAGLNGPIWKNKAWFSIGYAPQIFQRERELTHSNLRDASNNLLPPVTQLYTFYRRAERVLARFDVQPFSKLNIYGTYKWSPEINRGSIPSYGAEKSLSLTCLTTLCGADFTNQTGGRLNSVAATLAGSFIVTNNFVISARGGHYFLNNKLGTYGTGSVDSPRISCLERRSITIPPPPNPQWPFPAGFGCSIGGGNNYPSTFSSLFDTNTRDQIEADALYSVNWGGRHEFKGGYQRNDVKNDSDITQNDQIALYYGRTYVPGPGQPQQNMLRAISGINGILMHPDAVGVGSMRQYSSRVNASSLNQSYFIQDKWQPVRRLTLNLGLRMEEEDVPSPFEGVRGLKFGFDSKIAPRIGVSYDLTGDGKTRIWGFYGLFYDRFKLGGPGRTFAASESFLDLYFEIFPGDTMSIFNRALILGGGGIPANNPCPLGTTAPVVGRLRCLVNNNTVAEDDENLDPNTKPFQQREITFGLQRQLWKLYELSVRYSRKEVINAIEDASIPLAGAAGNEFFITGNPGKGLIKERFEELGLIAPKAQRQYDVLEVKFDRGFSDNYFFHVNYSYSRLYGNYSGLISSDEEGTRNDPNVQRIFDTPASGFSAAGGPDNGRLATDRPHVLKAFGTYTLPWDKFGLWKSHSTDFQLFYTASSGSVITSFVNINRNQQIILTKRGDQGRTPVFTQTDFALRHNWKFGRDGRYTVRLDTDIINLFNRGTLLNKGANPSGESGNLISEVNFNPLDPAYGLVQAGCLGSTSQECWAQAYRALQVNGSQALVQQAIASQSPFYNVHHTWQPKRTIRFGASFLF